MRPALHTQCANPTFLSRATFPWPLPWPWPCVRVRSDAAQSVMNHQTGPGTRTGGKTILMDGLSIFVLGFRVTCGRCGHGNDLRDACDDVIQRLRDCADE